MSSYFRAGVNYRIVNKGGVQGHDGYCEIKWNKVCDLRCLGIDLRIQGFTPE